MEQICSADYLNADENITMLFMMLLEAVKKHLR
jgi:hypothetical protein